MRTGLLAAGNGWSALVMLLLAGCGGGGGGGGGPPAPALTPVEYNGNSSQATVTGTNASRLITNVSGSGDTAALIAGTSVQGGGSRQARGGAAGVARILNRASRDSIANARRPRAVQGVPIDGTEPCDGGGLLRTFGSLDENNFFVGSLTAIFTDCVFEGVALNGSSRYSGEHV
jgi:hypothetical protein